jgi:hypothetical protein
MCSTAKVRLAPQRRRGVTDRLWDAGDLGKPVRVRREGRKSGIRFGSSYGCERLHRAWPFCTMRLVVALVSRQRNQVLSGTLRVSNRPEAIFHKTGRRCLDCCLALDVLAEGNSKVATIPKPPTNPQVSRANGPKKQTATQSANTPRRVGQRKQNTGHRGEELHAATMRLGVA